MTKPRYRTEKEAEELETVVDDANELAEKLGLEPYDVKYWIVDHDEMNELIAYGGFQDRYPHWRWGMQYDHQQKKGQLGMGKAFEIVNNDDPANAFLQVSNTLSDQKAVITHVEAHSDFFANNEWFGMFHRGDVDAVSMLSRHGDIIESYMDDPDIDRSEVEEFIDTVSCIEDTINQHNTFPAPPGSEDDETVTIEEVIDGLDLSSEVEGQVFSEEWIEENLNETDEEEPTEDVLKFLLKHGMEYDGEQDRAVEMEDWKKDILQILRAESYYFAPQKMTKVMNEGWAAFWESLMMADEQFADEDEFITYADHMSKVLGSQGINPYNLGMQLWQYAENRANRREVLDKLLRVDGVTWRNFHETVDMDAVMAMLEPKSLVDTITSDKLDQLEAASDQPQFDADAVDDALTGEIDLDDTPWKVLTYEGLAERHYSLCRRHNQSFLRSVSNSQLEEQARYILDRKRYDSIGEAINDVDYTAGWERMFDVRASHNDVTFIDEFLTAEFVDEYNYFTFEHSQQTDDFHVSSTEYEDVKRKLLLEFTNFGKPTIVAYDHNFHNRGELLLGHQYNGIMLNMDKACKVLERLYELWGRPVNLMTVVKDFGETEDDGGILLGSLEDSQPEVTEIAQRIRYDGSDFEFHPLDPELEEIIAAGNLDYDTKPDDWIQ